MALLYEFSVGDGVSLVNASKVLLFVGVFFVAAPLAAKLISLLIKRFDTVSDIPGLIPTTIVSLVLFFEIDWGSPFIWSFSLSFFVVAIIGKFAGALLIRESWPMRIVVGLAMAPRGEVGLIFAELGRASGIFNNEIYAGMVIVIGFTTLMPPFLMKWFYRLYGESLNLEADGTRPAWEDPAN